MHKKKNLKNIKTHKFIFSIFFRQNDNLELFFFSFDIKIKKLTSTKNFVKKLCKMRILGKFYFLHILAKFIYILN